MVKLDYKSGKPLHEQITMGIKELIIGGVLKTDQQLPSVRELSVSLTVNPNTVVAGVPEANMQQIETLYETLGETVKELIYWGENKEKICAVIDNFCRKE